MKQLLILEDDALLREVLRTSFRDRGFFVRDYATLKEWEEDKTLKPTHAILDLMLRGESGMAALVSVKRRFPACRAIILTGCGSIETAVQAVKLGAVNYLSKPATIDEMEDAFHDVPLPIVPCSERPGLYEHEREYIEKILQDMNGNISQAARVLGIHRQSLQRKLRKFT